MLSGHCLWSLDDRVAGGVCGCDGMATGFGRRGEGFGDDSGVLLCSGGAADCSGCGRAATSSGNHRYHPTPLEDR